MYCSRPRSSLLLALLAMTACGPDAPPAPAIPDEVQQEVARSIATNVIVPAIDEFEAAAAALEAALSAYASDPANADARATARAAFVDAMAAWERLEVMQVGPAGASMSSVVGGQGLRYEIYSWPQIDRCAINQETALASYADVDAFATTAVNVRGLGALEYLLFDESRAHECTSGAPQPWPPVDDADLVARRASYASTVATLVHRQATALSDAWDPAAGNFLGQFAWGDAGTSVYPSGRAALNAISEAMFYVYSETKDRKVAVPMNLDGVSCAFAVCADAVEAPHADLSIADIRENLVALRALFIGGEPGSTNVGFDDLLAEVDRPDVADTMLAEIDEAVAACEAFMIPLEVALVTELPSVQALYAEIKNVTDLLKGQFAALLDLEVPAAAAGDND